LGFSGAQRQFHSEGRQIPGRTAHESSIGQAGDCFSALYVKLAKDTLSVVVCGSKDIDFEAWDIAPWTGWHGACRSLFRRTPGSRSPLCRFVSPQFLFRLNAVSLYDRRNQSWKALVDFRASRRVVHLDASPFATN
jgi:hypothetical protein